VIGRVRRWCLIAALAALAGCGGSHSATPGSPSASRASRAAAAVNAPAAPNEIQALRAQGWRTDFAKHAVSLTWTPCVGPTLGAILSAAAISSSALHGAVLLAFYSAGLAIPLLATALAFERMTSVFAAVKRHFRFVTAAGGLVLIAVGVLVWTGELFQLNIQAQQALDSLGITFFNPI